MSGEAKRWNLGMEKARSRRDFVWPIGLHLSTPPISPAGNPTHSQVFSVELWIDAGNLCNSRLNGGAGV